MAKQTTIKRYCSALLLIIFIIGITPKKILHDVFANHKDTEYKQSATGNGLAIRLSVIHCQCDDLVIESPYIPGQVSNYIVVAASYISFICRPAVHLPLALHCSSHFRGPPAINA